MDHREYGINVKAEGGYWDDPVSYTLVGEAEVENIWQMYTDRFWSDAEYLAREHNLDGAWQEGRSGGWLVGHKDGEAVELTKRFTIVIERLQVNIEAELLEAIRDRAAEIERIERTNALAEAGWRS